MKNVRNTLRTLPFTSFRTLWPEQPSVVKEDLRKLQEKSPPRKKHKIGTSNRAGCFLLCGSKDFRKHHTKETKPCH